MSDDQAATAPQPDFETIEAAVLETARGRWFLAEHARRIRMRETGKVLAAIEQLAELVAISRPGAAGGEPKLRAGIGEMARIIARAKAETASALPAGTASGSGEAFAGVLRSLDQASADILDAAGEVHEATWLLREQGANAALCDALERYATTIYAACGTHGVGAYGAARLVQAIGLLEQRIAELMGRADPAKAPPARALPAESLERPAAAAEPPSIAAPALPRPVETQPVSLQVVAGAEVAPEPIRPARSVLERMKVLAEIDALDTREKLLRFT